MNTERSSRQRGLSDHPRSEQMSVDRIESTTVDVVLASPDGSVRSRLRARLEQHGGFVVAAEKANATQALGSTLFHSPRVCLLDIDLPGALEDRIKSMRAERPDTRIGILAHSADQPGLLGAVLAGADGVLLTSESHETFAAQVQALARGERVLPPDRSESDGAETASPPPEPKASRSEYSRPSRHGTPLALTTQHHDRLLRASVLYVPRFSRHPRRRLRSGMSLSAAWKSARVRMRDYRH